MIVAVLGAVNGDVEALERALHHAEEAGILSIFQTGDVAAGGPAPNEAIALLRARKVTVVQGERDRALVRHARKPDSWRGRLDDAAIAELAAARDALTSENLEWLNRLPRKRTLEIDGTTLCVCHGSPAAQGESLSPDLPQHKFDRFREIDPADIIVCGGAKSNFARHVGDTLICAVGALRAADEGVQVCLVSNENGKAVMDVAGVD